MKNVRTGIKLLLQAARQGDAPAQRELYELFRSGSPPEVLPNEEQATKWLLKLAENGDAEAQRLAGWAYARGEGGLNPDSRRAVAWWSKAAANGDREALLLVRSAEEHVYTKQLYDGDVRDGQRHGQGRLVLWRDKERFGEYVGQFRLGREEGHGRYVGARGEYYDGEWKDGRVHGSGGIRFIPKPSDRSQGTYFFGTWRDGVFVEGARYAGPADAPEALLTRLRESDPLEVPYDTAPLLCLTAGQYAAPKPYLSFDTVTFLSSSSDFKLHGSGTVFYPDVKGSAPSYRRNRPRYVGDFERGYAGDRGRLYHPDGRLEYEGEVYGCCGDRPPTNRSTRNLYSKSGTGTEFGDNGDVAYVGSFRGNVRHGQGREFSTLRDGTTVSAESSWRDGRRRGVRGILSPVGENYLMQLLAAIDDISSDVEPSSSGVLPTSVRERPSGASRAVARHLRSRDAQVSRSGKEEGRGPGRDSGRSR